VLRLPQPHHPHRQQQQQQALLLLPAALQAVPQLPAAAASHHAELDLAAEWLPELQQQRQWQVLPVSLPGLLLVTPMELLLLQLLAQGPFEATVDTVLHTGSVESGLAAAAVPAAAAAAAAVAVSLAAG
jgi:hypothetical protein